VILLGYPPADVALREWVLDKDINDQVAARKRLHAFLYALLNVTRTTLEDIETKSNEGKPAETETETEEGVIRRQEKLAKTFRDRMTEDQSFHGSNNYRKDFYNRVTESADKVNFHGFPYFGEDDSFSSSLKAFKSSWILTNRSISVSSTFLKIWRG
jgi:hypothetical protein